MPVVVPPAAALPVPRHLVVGVPCQGSIPSCPEKLEARRRQVHEAPSGGGGRVKGEGQSINLR